jgi:hypothetical protein
VPVEVVALKATICRQMTEQVRVTESLRMLMAEVVDRIDSPDEDAFLDADDAVQVEDAWGGRVERDRFRFIYRPDDATAWVITLRERQVRDVAEGHLQVVSAERDTVGIRDREPESGDPLLVWGDGPADALSVRELEHLRVVLTALAASATRAPRWFRLWSRRDDLMFGVVTSGECSLQVVWSGGGYATSRGNDEQTEEFEAPNGEGSVTKVPWSDCVEWRVALQAALEFTGTGKLGTLPVKERVRPDVVVRAAGGRSRELASRASPPPANPETSSFGTSI